MRKFNIADRNLDRVLIEFDFMLLDSSSISLGYYQAESKYKESAPGLQESCDQSYTINLNYAIGPRVNTYAFLWP